MGQGWDRDGTGTGQGRDRDGTGTGPGRWDGTGRGARQYYPSTIHIKESEIHIDYQE